MKKKSIFTILGILLLLPGFLSAQIQNKGIATLKVVNSRVVVIRNGEIVKVGPFGLVLENNDQLQTDGLGKGKIMMNSGDTLYLASNARLVINQEASVNNNMLKKIFLSIWGKIRVQAVKNKKRELKVRTDTATIGVKGTDFVVEYLQKKTTVATIRGLVKMTALKTNKSLFIPKGKMSGIALDGKILPLEEITGKVIEGVEIVGRKVNSADFNGKKISF